MSRMHVDAPARSALMLGFSGYSRQMITPAVARLAEVVKRQPKGFVNLTSRLATQHFETP
jgi:hypothetical protein